MNKEELTQREIDKATIRLHVETIEKLSSELATERQKREEAEKLMSIRGNAIIIANTALLHHGISGHPTTEDGINQLGEKLSASNQALAEAREAMRWKPIETAPKDGTEILIWRKDSGWLLARWIAPCDFLHERELESMELKDTEEPDWFYADFVCGGRLDGGSPTHWMPLPIPPLTPEKEGKV